MIKAGDTGTIRANTTITASFTNKKDADTPLSPPDEPDVPDTPPSPPVEPDEPDTPDTPPVTPDQPSNPGNPGTPENPSDPAIPKTGDDSNMLLWLGLCLASFIGMSTCILSINRKKYKATHLKKR